MKIATSKNSIIKVLTAVVFIVGLIGVTGWLIFIVLLIVAQLVAGA